MMCLPSVNQEFFPNSKRPEIILDVNLPSGASIEETKRVMAGIADNLYGDKRIESFSTYVGDSAPVSSFSLIRQHRKTATGR